jgi:endonuclease/exonuclease/phosphatase family metal-dependent hydrolase
VTRNFHRNGDADLVAAFNDLLPDYFTVFGAACDVDAGSEVIDGRAVSRRFQFGNMILSRYPLLATRTLLLPRSRTFDRLNLQRAATEALIDTPVGLVRVYSVHLDHRDPHERIDQIHELKARVTRYGLEGGAVTGAVEFGFADPPSTDDFVIMGDFNMMPETPEYNAMCGVRDPFYGRSLRSTNPCDALAHFGKTGPQSYSWVDPPHPETRQLLDYCFLSPGLAQRFADGWIDTSATGSDHMPLWIELT